ncbi:hypothetical protein [Sorangium sp. So ce1000]|uniref:hypothetical protein n=1 Tax=Sorangium sp. So ce1000 TaxID=3133325 RepID=UPI003F625319
MTDGRDTRATPSAPPPPAEPWGAGRGCGPISPRHPLGGEMSDVARGIFSRLRLPRRLQRYAQVPVLAAFSFVNGFVSIGLWRPSRRPLVRRAVGARYRNNTDPGTIPSRAYSADTISS